MIRKRKLAIFLFCLLLIPSNALASTVNYGYFGTTSETDLLWADSTQKDDVWTSVTIDGAASGEIVWIKLGGYENGRNPNPGTYSAPAGSVAFKLVSNDGKEIYAVTGSTTNPNNTTVTFTPGTTSGGGGSNSGCDACEIFSCPGWGEYMQGLEDIKNAIPPAPNWQTVANTFKNTIVPAIILDLGDLLGNAPEPPNVPEAPSVPNQPSDLDDRDIQAPTGQEAAGLGDSTFDSDDIKNGASVIQEREDPTGGGFEILDPVAGLPSQDEFMENLPNEGEATLPGSPAEGDNVAPMPGDTTDEAPTPNDDTGTAPLPSESGEAPIPGDDGGGAPLPNEDWNPPIPGKP